MMMTKIYCIWLEQEEVIEEYYKYYVVVLVLVEDTVVSNCMQTTRLQCSFLADTSSTVPGSRLLDY